VLRVGADVGATLVKLAVATPGEPASLRTLPVDSLEQVAREIEAARPESVGLTGGGAGALAALLSVEAFASDEFSAWRTGSRPLLEACGVDADEPYLLVSVGTGTSAMRVEGTRVARVGGTALGGGTIVGLGAALVGTADFADLASLAQQGDRRRIDLLVSEIYRTGDSPLPGDLNASSFAKLALGSVNATPARADLAHAIMGLVGENVALICNGLAAAAGVKRIVFGGTSLRENESLVEILRILTAVGGREAVVLPDGEFAGALGAMELAAG
jgi:type II pantothenate kinase